MKCPSETTAGACAGEYTITRTFTATDDCGNSSSATQTITVHELSIPADYTAECSDELVMDDATATDNCGEVSIEVSSETTAGACAGEYTITRRQQLTTVATAAARFRRSRFKTRRLLSSRAFLPITLRSALTSL